MTNPLRELAKFGQSVWYDNLNRSLIPTGMLQRLVDEDGVSGGTSNPSIFEKAVASGDYYDAHLKQLVDAGADLPAIYDALTIADIQQCADVFLPVYERSNGADGYASIEVSPELAYDTAGTIAAARRLARDVGRPNVMIKIPGTPEGLPAVEQCLSDGINVNITLLFGVESYEQVARTYMQALQRRLDAGQPIDRIASVASFFVSRVDTLTDERLQQKIEAASGAAERERLASLLGTAAVANAKIAYAKFKALFAGPQWENLAAAGARPQRCLWASTSTKNPAYRDVVYVEQLIGPQTVNTLPQATVDAFRDHGIVAPTLERDPDGAFEAIRRIEAAGIDFRAVTDDLQSQGVQLFVDSYLKGMDSIHRKREAVLSGSIGAPAS